MTRALADDLWGEAAVARALAESEPDAVTADLAAAVRAHLASPGALRAWALAQPWPRFCAVVHVVSGAYRDAVLAQGDQAAPEYPTAAAPRTR